MKVNVKSGLLAASACTLVFPMASAHAQAGAETNAGDIVVTARKREESILKVPVIASVLTEEQLVKNQIRDLTDITRSSTGLLIAAATPDVGALLSLRGVGTTVTEPGIDSSTSLNVDGLQLSHGSAYTSALFDMQQVEILKGPQALFFGKSSPAGVVAIRTADPGPDYEVVGRVGYEFVAKEIRTEGILSGPITETLGARLAFLYDHDNGYFKNVAQVHLPSGGGPIRKDWETVKSMVVRGTLLFAPTDQFSARLKVNYVRDRREGSIPRQLASCPDGTVNYTGIPFFAPDEDCKPSRRIAVSGYPLSTFPLAQNDADDFVYTTQKYGTLELNYDVVDAITVTSVTGYYDSELNGLFNATNSGFAAPTIASGRDFDRKEFMEEIRVNSNFEGPLNFTAGGFYQDGSMYDELFTQGNVVLGFPSNFSRRAHDLDIESLSLFGQVRFRPVEQLEISAGARWTHEKRSDYITQYVAAGIIHPTVPDLSTKNWSPELTITYTPTDDLTVFGSLKQGYKSGSYALRSVAATGDDNSFGDEKVQGGELGIKSQLADRQIFVNFAGYYYKYSDLQVGSIVFPPGGGVPQTFIVNAASSKVYGVDFDLRYTPRDVDGLSLTTAINWNKAKFTKFDSAPCQTGQTFAEGCNLAPNSANGLFNAQDLGGTPLIRAPEWQMNAAIDYEMPAGENMVLSFGANAIYSSKFLTTLGTRPDFFQKGYAKFGANVSLKDSNDAWELSLIGKNLSDKLTTGACDPSNFAGGAVLPGMTTGGTTRGPAGDAELLCTFERGREVWLRLTLRPSAF